MAKQKAKKRHIANSDTDSENSYPASQPTKPNSSSSSTSTKTPYVPRFLLIHSEQEETISSLSPFLVHKTIMSLTGEPKSIKTLRSGDLLIQCAKESHEKTLLQMKTFCNLKCSVKPHSSLNTSKGIVRCPALSKVTTEHIIEFMGEQGVTDVRRITVRRDGILKPTNTFVLTFNTPILPTVVKIGFIQVKVDVYIPNPLRCYNCQVFGHHENKCGRHPVCCNCAQPEHCASGQCDKPAKCVNCSGDHPANSKECPQWEKEKQILKIKCEQSISFPEARKQFEQFNGAKTYASAVKPGTCNKSTQTDNKSTQTDDSFNEYLQQQETEKTKESTPRKSNSSPHPGKSNSSPGPALKAGTLEMIKKDEEKKRKEEKDKLKKQQKEERKQIFLKEQAQKEKELIEKAKQAEKNPYSVFAEKDGEEVMDDESVVFTEPSSSDHLPKGTLSRLPLT